MGDDTRREFFVKVGVGAGAAALATQAAMGVRSVLPNVSYDSPTTVKVGPPTEFPEGVKYLPDERLFVFRDGNTFHAISAVCTHLGCTVRIEAEQTEKRAFVCPCHGSAYARDGKPLSGPAPTPLKAYHLSVAPDDGQITVDLDRPVDAAFRLSIA